MSTEKQESQTRDPEIPVGKRTSIIYHYCSIEAFASIIQSKQLWLSNSYALSDYSENTWIVPQIKNKLAELRSETTAAYLDEVAKLYDLNNVAPYIASFSANGDLLSQWRAYSNDGTGVSIGFNSAAFKVKFRLPMPAAVLDLCIGLAPVLYDIEQQKAQVAHAIEHNLQMYLNKKVDQANAMIASVSLLRRFACAFKNPAFSEEIEWRLIHVPLIFSDAKGNITLQSAVSPLKFRANKGKLTSYFEFPLKVDSTNQPISEVISGPKSEVSDSAIDLILNYNGYRRVVIKRSTASYR